MILDNYILKTASARAAGALTFFLQLKKVTKKAAAVTPKPKIIPENLNSKNSPLRFMRRFMKL
jgi:hypothetical protein